MFQAITDGNPLKEWLNVAHLLEPCYDYFNFADIYKKDADTTNCVYLSLLNHQLSKANKKAQTGILDAIKLFNRRRNKATKFYSQYSKYWDDRKIEEASLQFEENAKILKKRTFEALQDISKNIIDNVVETSKRLYSQENAQSTCTHTKSSVEVATNLFQEMTGLKALNIGDECVAVVIDESALVELRQKTSLKPYSLSIATASLLELISKDNTSLLVLIDIIKSYQLPTNEPFDSVQHTDVTFIETIGLYFVNLALSPRNPLHFQTLECTTAVQTSIFFLNSLFLSVNDRISFNWIEIETFLTGKTKWDGVGFCPTMDKKIGIVLVEFSGGILWNKTKRKIDKDMKKIE
ncbi:hypothetical protein G6F58_007371 [Rhizopus delemar]|nr:hypothetical protein G6F58_007371 [Rhizopus delemar]